MWYYNKNKLTMDGGYWVLFDGTNSDGEEGNIYPTAEEAARRVNYLNGGAGLPYPTIEQIERGVDNG